MQQVHPPTVPSSGNGREERAALNSLSEQPVRLRWLIGSAVGLGFALGQVIETLVLDGPRLSTRLMLDVLLWGMLGALAVHVTLSWAARREQRYAASLRASLHEQQLLAAELAQREHELQILSRATRYFAEQATHDQVLRAALEFPRQLVPANVAALILYDHTRTPVVVRVEGLQEQQLATLRAQFPPVGRVEESGLRAHNPSMVQVVPALDGETQLILPLLNEGEAVGWIELYSNPAVRLAEQTRAVIQTIAAEIAEALVQRRLAPLVPS